MHSNIDTLRCIKIYFYVTRQVKIVRFTGRFIYSYVRVMYYNFRFSSDNIYFIFFFFNSTSLQKNYIFIVISLISSRGNNKIFRYSFPSPQLKK